ncbi:conserved hypothetical protein [Shewanella denitrificans OS217]|jgi:hypothetical protein|uniref:Transmembrane protein n=1 Tax=Shewanella denitrificans (strain OS217 / ATCC BAA-1090 / DSM 15013) TaxID=318161 RepID=Q12IC9_SHEDO|nr:hypothetical protein [Shewanella denitrificans]ABE56797.1 conserved hypothetical protein [Shewanella denitrificans OS217]
MNSHTPIATATTVTKTVTKKRPKALFVLILVFVLPVALAKLVLSLNLYQGGATNQGELLTGDISYQSLTQANPKPHSWQILYLLPSHCGSQCQDRLYILQQSHIALGQVKNRVAPIIIVQSNSDVSALDKLELNYSTMTANTQLASLLVEQQMIIVDPLGNLVMRYDGISGRDANISQGKAMLADLRKMLKLSRVG